MKLVEHTLTVVRQHPQGQPYQQSFAIRLDAHERISVADALNMLNGQRELTDIDGKRAELPIGFDCGCLTGKCGACAMLIDGIPKLACKSYFDGPCPKTITVAPLSVFPCIRDLIVDRTAIFDALEQNHVWLESQRIATPKRIETSYKSSMCMMCGCCLEVCPNFGKGKDFLGALFAANAARVFAQEDDRRHADSLRSAYRKGFHSHCGKSLSCRQVCPASLDLESLISRSNAAALWNIR